MVHKSGQDQKRQRGFGRDPKTRFPKPIVLVRKLADTPNLDGLRRSTRQSSGLRSYDDREPTLMAPRVQQILIALLPRTHGLPGPRLRLPAARHKFGALVTRLTVPASFEFDICVNHGFFYDRQEVLVLLQGPAAPGRNVVRSGSGHPQPDDSERYDLTQLKTCHAYSPQHMPVHVTVTPVARTLATPSERRALVRSTEVRNRR
jgi:hypothetical protein